MKMLQQKGKIDAEKEMFFGSIPHSTPQLKQMLGKNS